jgi:excinuclease ABC subunit C
MKTSIPAAPGIYLFKNKDKTVLYIGKAKCLKTRVQSYFHSRDNDLKIGALVEEYDHVSYILTKNETEALLLEAELIRMHQPKYNVMLKGGQPFVYILFTKEDIPKIKLVRNKRKKGTYFGPFIHKSHAQSVYHFLLHTFKLRLCNKTIENGCLDYHLGICAGNCRKSFDTKDYQFRLELAIRTLRSTPQDFIALIHKKISEYTQRLAFEKAQQLYSYIQHCDTIFSTIKTKFSVTRFLHDIALITTQTEIPTDLQTQTLVLAQFLCMESEPKTIDCFDISHFQSTSIVGSCIRFTHGIPDKNKFRRFKITSLEQQNDYAALAEIVARRYKNKDDIPDLILIDGGTGQLNTIRRLLPNSEIVALAKREEQLFSPRFPEGKKLDIHTKVGRLLIGLRDYAHHFAISYHRNQRRKSIRA